MMLREWLQYAATTLKNSQCECADPLLHAKQITETVLGLSQASMIANPSKELTKNEENQLNAVLVRRADGEPFQYIVGDAGFYKNDFKVGPGVLIPRKETEHLVESILENRKEPNLKVLELGPGSGNICISVLNERPTWEWHAFEKNPKTIPYLKANIQNLLNPNAKLIIHEGDFFELAKNIGQVDLIVSNPPYVSTQEMKEISREVGNEPEMALFGGQDGMDIIVRLLAFAQTHLKDNGLFVSEIGSRQGELVKTYCVRHGFANYHVLNDYAGHPRVLVCKRGT